MDNQNQSQFQPQPQSIPPTPAPENMRTKKKVWVVVVAVIILILLIGGWFVWQNYFSPDAQYQRKISEGQRLYNQAVSEYQRELKEDIYGGKTPEETIAMFVDALKKGDVELASKYFFVDASGDRSEWINGLEKAKVDGRLDSMVAELDNVKRISISSDLGVADLGVLDKDGNIIHEVLLKLNSVAEIWKIESL
jgi:type II secretory pathway pseudopilin PulG